MPTRTISHGRMLTGENWNDIMQSCMVQEDCVYVPQTVVALLGNGKNMTVDAGAYLDPNQHATLLSALPSSVLVRQQTIGPHCMRPRQLFTV
jgi:hypothetical protein